MTPQVGVAVVGTDSNKRFMRRHVTYSAVDPGNILKQIIDVAINDLIASDPTATVFLARETLACEKFYIAIMNSYSKCLCLVSIYVDRLFMRGTINERGQS